VKPASWLLNMTELRSKVVSAVFALIFLAFAPGHGSWTICRGSVVAIPTLALAQSIAKSKTALVHASLYPGVSALADIFSKERIALVKVIPSFA